jgi:hypothetical protein
MADFRLLFSLFLAGAAKFLPGHFLGNERGRKGRNEHDARIAACTDGGNLWTGRPVIARRQATFFGWIGRNTA